MDPVHSGAISLDFDPTQLLQDAEHLLEDSGFDSWLMRTIGGGAGMDLDTGASGNAPTGAAPAAPQQHSSVFRSMATPGPRIDLAPAQPTAPAVAGDGAGPAAAAAASAAAAGGEASKDPGDGERLVKLPPGHELVQVAPGLYALRQVSAATQANATAVPPPPPPPPQQQQQQPAAVPPQPQEQPPVLLPQLQQVLQLQEAAAGRREAQQIAAVQAQHEAHIYQTQQQRPSAMRDSLLCQAQSRLRMAFTPAGGSGGGGALASADRSSSGGSSAASDPATRAALGGGVLPTAGHSHSNARGAAAAGAGAAAAAPKAAAPGGKRASSQRFRERQKELIHELEHEVTSKLEQMQLLAQENEMLKLRSSVLERAVEGREEQIDIIKNFGMIWPERPDCSNGGASEDGPTCCAGGPRASGSPSGGGGAAPDASNGSGSLDASDDVMSSWQRQQLQRPAQDAAAAAGMAGAAGGAPREDWWNEPVPTIEDIKKMTPEDAKLRWRKFLHHASRELMALQREEEEAGVSLDTLAAAEAANAGRPGRTAENAPGAAWGGAAGGGPAKDGGGSGGGSGDGSGGPQGPYPKYYNRRPLPQGTPNSTAVARIHALCDRYMSVIKHVVLLNPAATYALVGINLDTGLPEPAPDSFWRGVVAQLRLTPKQASGDAFGEGAARGHGVDDVLAFHELYSSIASRVLAERAVLQQRLGAAGTGEQPLMQLRNTTLAMQTAEALANNIKKEHALSLLLDAFIYARCLTPVQLARMSVFSYPLLPDAASVTHVICEDAQALNPGGPRRRVFAHHSEQQRANAMQAAQARIAALAAGNGISGLSNRGGGAGVDELLGLQALAAGLPAPLPGHGEAAAVPQAQR